jgi:hypothetical protein
MIWKVLIAAGVTAVELGGFMIANTAYGQAPSTEWVARAGPVMLPVEPSAPRGSDFTPPAPRGNLRGDIAANSKDGRHDHDTPAAQHKRTPH